MILGLRTFQVGRFKGVAFIHFREWTPSLNEIVDSAGRAFEEKLRRQLVDPEATRIFGEVSDSVGLLSTAINAAQKSLPVKFRKTQEMWVACAESTYKNSEKKFLLNTPNWIKLVVESENGELNLLNSGQEFTEKKNWETVLLSAHDFNLNVCFFGIPRRWSFTELKEQRIYWLAHLIERNTNGGFAEHCSIRL